MDYGFVEATRRCAALAAIRGWDEDHFSLHGIPASRVSVHVSSPVQQLPAFRQDIDRPRVLILLVRNMTDGRAGHDHAGRTLPAAGADQSAQTERVRHFVAELEVVKLATLLAGIVNDRRTRMLDRDLQQILPRYELELVVHFQNPEREMVARDGCFIQFPLLLEIEQEIGLLRL